MRTWTRLLWPILLVALGGGACKTSDKKTSLTQLGETYGGVFDNNGRVKIKVPIELSGFTPSSGLRTHAEATPTLDGLNLANAAGKPVSTQGIEEVITKCFTHDSEFIAENWYFYVELRASGKVVRDYNSREVSKCNEMQLELKTLEKNTTYEVIAQFFWQSQDQKMTIVWYEGKTQPFKPSDRNISLVLEKLRTDQVVDVEVEKTEKERCVLRNYLWNGQRCLDGFNALSFGHADLSDYATAADSAGARTRKCLQIGDQGYAVQFSCDYKQAQRLKALLHGVQKLPKDLPPKEYGWFSLQFDGGTSCLQAQVDPQGSSPYLVAQDCDSALPHEDQLFTLIATQTGDAGGRNSFRIMNQFDGKARCLSVPPEKGDKTGVAPLRDGAPVRLTDCQTSEPNTKLSQFIRFVDVTD